MLHPTLNRRKMLLSSLAFTSTPAILCAQDRPVAEQKFISSPGDETSEAKKLIDSAVDAIRAGKTPSDLLANADFLPAHEWPRFRKLIREKATAAPLNLVVPTEPGEPLIVTGKVLSPEGKPVKGAEIYVYQTSAKGWYSDRAFHVSGNEGDRRHARLFGYVLSDESGQFE